MRETPEQLAVLVNGMRDAIHEFEEERLSVDRLAWELKSRIAALRHVADEAWADELKGIWNQLEMINALYIESGNEKLDSAERKDIEEVLDELRAALLAY